eukprot:c7050_g1_i1.p1 GENE.c7050_g1_i1~~c7050_g1_i1.p1  ORF type:complete len:320 (+),score=88.96 c7050_g1_i1:67-960(+)
MGSFRLGTCICIGFFVGLICFIVSWQSLEIDEYGLNCNTFTKSVDSTAFTEGRYFLGLTHKFVVFPRTLQSVEFKANQLTPQLRGRTSDGLLVELEVSFQYKFFQDKIFDLYSEYGTDYKHAISRMARAVLTSAASTYTAYDFFSDRQTIASIMHEQLAAELQRSLHAEVAFFQLLDVNLPDLFENAIEEAQVAAQNIVRVRHELETVRVQTQTQIMQARYQANITLTGAHAAAESIALHNQADIDVFKYSQLSRAEAFAELKTATGFNTTQLLNYIKIQALDAHTDTQLVIGLSNP